MHLSIHLSVTPTSARLHSAPAEAIERCCQLGKPINNLSADKRDYLRGGAAPTAADAEPLPPRSVLIISVRIISDRGSQIPCPNTEEIHSKPTLF